MRKLYALWLTVVVFLVPQLASAYCSTYTVILSQTTLFGDGSVSVLITGWDTYDVCDAGGGGADGGPDGGGSGGGTGSVTSPIPPYITLVNIDTTDPYQPIVTADVATNDPDDPVNRISLDVNGTTVDSSYSSGTPFARYQLHLPAIIYFPDGTTSLTAKACSAALVCAQVSANMYRTTPSPNKASVDMFATWLEMDEAGTGPLEGPIPVSMSAYFGHGLRQMYTTTLFGGPEVGENSHYLIRDSLVTVSGVLPLPDWKGAVRASGTIGWWNSWDLFTSANPVDCTFPVRCSSKSGGVSGAFGYAPSVSDQISSVLMDGQPVLVTNTSLSISFP